MACSECNTARGDLPIEEFIYSIQKPYSNTVVSKDQKLEKVRQRKEAKSHRNRIRLFMVAAWMSPKDYQHIMENVSKHDARTVFKGGIKPTTPRKHLMNNIRHRVQENRMAA